MAIDSSLYRMADRLADGDLVAILQKMKAAGDSNGTIAKRLYADHGIDVTAQTVSNWWTAITATAGGDAA